MLETRAGDGNGRWEVGDGEYEHRTSNIQSRSAGPNIKSNGTAAVMAAAAGRDGALRRPRPKRAHPCRRLYPAGDPAVRDIAMSLPVVPAMMTGAGIIVIR